MHDLRKHALLLVKDMSDVGANGKTFLLQE